MYRVGAKRYKTLHVVNADPYAKTVGGYEYDKPQAEAACKAQGLRLCRKHELMDKDVCNYGWTENAGTGYPMANGVEWYDNKENHENPEERKKKGWCGGRRDGWRDGGENRKAAAHCCYDYSDGTPCADTRTMMCRYSPTRTKTPF